MSSFSGLLNNAALMLLLCVVYDTFGVYAISNRKLRDGLTGVLVGLISIAVMLSPWSLHPGVFFDTRWVLLSLCGLFFGVTPTVVAIIIAGTFRLSMGGAGGFVGTVVIVVTACLGLVWKYWKEKNNAVLGWKQLYVFGFLVQLAMLLCMFLMPADMRIPIIKTVAPPILLIYPFLTMFIGLILKRQEDRRKAELELEESRETLSKERGLLKGVVNSITDAILFVDLDRQILMTNPAFKSIFGYDMEEVVGKNTQFIYANHDDYLHLGEKRFNRNFPSNLPRYEIEYRRKNGSIFPSETLGVPVKDSNDLTIGFLGVIHDVSDRKLAEKEKEKLESRLQQSQKMEAVGTLAGGIAHDFNNILGIILGYTELAKEDAPPDSNFVKDLDRVLEAGNRAKDLVKQILSFSRQSQVERMVLKPQPVIGEFLKMLRASIPTTIEIRQNIAPDCGAIDADPTQLHQILMNLCTNAFHAMENKGGILNVGLQVARTIPVELQAGKNATDDTFLELSISDTGQGIGPDIINNIFDPFFTTKDQGKGTGMGLSITYGIVKDYHGTITVDSQLGEGTTFHVYLPLSRKDAPQTSENKVISIEGRERILFVDDEELLATMGKDMLERLGYHVTVRQSSLEAIELFQNRPDDFDLVITDQTMPGMTGLDMAKRMLQIRFDIPIILCTGYSSMVDEKVAKAQGIKRFALKPLNKSATAKLIRQVLDEGSSARRQSWG